MSISQDNKKELAKAYRMLQIAYKIDNNYWEENKEQIDKLLNRAFDIIDKTVYEIPEIVDAYNKVAEYLLWKEELIQLEEDIYLAKAILLIIMDSLSFSVRLIDRQENTQVIFNSDKEKLSDCIQDIKDTINKLKDNKNLQDTIKGLKTNINTKSVKDMLDTIIKDEELDALASYAHMHYKSYNINYVLSESLIIRLKAVKEAIEESLWAIS